MSNITMTFSDNDTQADYESLDRKGMRDRADIASAYADKIKRTKDERKEDD